jgi:hypothetical protein
MATADGSSVTVQIDYPAKLSRLLIFVKWLLVIPQAIAVYVLGIAAAIVLFIAWFATVITGRYPRGLFNFLAGYERWRLRVSSYVLLQTDHYPPFSLTDDRSYPVRFEVAYPERVARWRPFVTWLLVIPAQLVLLVVGLGAAIGSIAAWFAILFTGRYPRSLFNLTSYALTLTTRTLVYSYWMSPEYPL